MKIIINSLSNEPIYKQIENQIKELIISGKLKLNEPIPSIRVLAKELKISVITIKRAYDDLEAEGYIYTVVGKGCFINAIDTKGIQILLNKNIEEEVSKLIEKAHKYNVSLEALIKLLNRKY